ncbi:MAG: sensor histidine kinase [Chloroflexi bacterium]|nr:sensor histidine kinase [Chloroflexota bacterium]
MPPNHIRRNFFSLTGLEGYGFSVPKQLYFLQWALPILLTLIVVSDEVYEYAFDNTPLWSKVFAIEVCLFGIICPIVVWFALGWMREMWLDREQNHKALLQAYDELNTAQARLKILHIQRGELLSRLMSVQEEERRHLSREIHDELGQLLTGLSLNLKVCQGAIPVELQQAHRYLNQANALVQQTIDQAHRIITGLRPAVLDDYGLLPALQEELQQRLDPLGLQVKLEAQGDLAQLPADVATTAFRITQEAITNIIRHAQARQVTVHLLCTASGLAAEITDNGVGIKVNAPKDQAALFSGLDKISAASENSGPTHPHLGIIGMQERATAMGGWLKIVPHKPTGAKVKFWLPIAQVVGEPEVRLDEKIDHTRVRLSNSDIRQPLSVEFNL